MELTSTLLMHIDIEGESKKKSLSELRNMAYEENESLRKAAYYAEADAYKVISKASACLNGISGEALTILMASRMNHETLNAMFSAIKESLPMFHKYYHKKSQKLGHKSNLPFYDIFAPMGEANTKISYLDARDLIVSSFKTFSQELANFAKKVFDCRWIDAEPRNGKYYLKQKWRWKMKDLISIKKLTTSEIVSLLDFADDIKEWHKKGKEYKPLKDKTVITSFPATSLRTRISFETGIFQLGANSINMEIEFEGKEPLDDKVGYLNCWIDFLVIRYPSQDIIEQIAENAHFSVVNAMSRQSHPCEILSDLQTIREKRGDLKNLKFVFVGEGANISNTWFEVAARLNLNLTQVCPEGYEVNEKIFEYAKINSKGEINITNDIEKGLKYADIILTDGWPVKREDQEQFKKFLPYQINMNNIEIANNDCLINPCPPFTRGNEIDNEVIKSKHFIGYSAKESLLHMQKAILATLKK